MMTEMITRELGKALKGILGFRMGGMKLELHKY